MTKIYAIELFEIMCEFANMQKKSLENSRNLPGLIEDVWWSNADPSWHWSVVFYIPKIWCRGRSRTRTYGTTMMTSSIIPEISRKFITLIWVRAVCKRRSAELFWFLLTKISASEIDSRHASHAKFHGSTVWNFSEISNNFLRNLQQFSQNFQKIKDIFDDDSK